MTRNKIIFGTGNTPKASDFAIGELVINVTDQKVFSKDKQNIVFEIQGASSNSGDAYISSSFDSNIITFNQGDGTTEQVDLTPIINASGDDDWFIDTSNNRITASLDIYVEGNITSSGDISATGNISASGDLFGDQLRVGNGSVSSPAIIFGNTSPSTGIYSPAQNNLALQIGGGEVEFNLNPSQTKLITPKFIVNSNITASGDISASGFVAAQYIKLRDSNPPPTVEKGIIIYSASNFYAGIE